MTMNAPMRDNPINERAFEWLVRADGGLSSAEQAELGAWLASDSRHYGAYIRAKAVFNHVGRAKAFAHLPNPDEWPLVAQPGERRTIQTVSAADNDRDDIAPVSRRALLGLASGAVVAGLTVAFFATGQPAEALTFRTRRGEMRDIALTDGTRVALNTESEIRVLFGERLRKVELVGGEALFDVAHEAGRAFVVDAIAFQARAVAASFAIRKIGGVAPQLVVREGAVDLTPANATSLRVSANSRVWVFSGGKVSRHMLTQAELGRELMWREGKIAFEDTPLRYAISAFDRYGSVHIEVDDPAILDHTVTGVFSSDDPMGFAKAVSEVFDLDAVPQGRGIILRKRD
ncbi:hypothetical protein V475_06125 [Sphingobium baderi LL03]|uniref:FecR protein domain-containing protein n=2 Tax=Sphingobium baderi TaxID=1332080 RepID=T0GQG2_9SPHN|nr:hypothetical protein L485_00645 [Sphingobium baderi LL03]KMS62828.1 hypothetical protein V475_06125 [Sphingobium baderi LL03]